MKNLLRAFVFIAFLGISGAFANNIRVGSATLTGQDVTAGANSAANFTFVRFDIDWDNSWKISSGPSNWDAAWVFVKYRIEGGTGCTPGGWQHATLSNAGGTHSVTTPNGVGATITPSADGKGVFMYRSADGTGSIDWDQVLLRWNYGADGILDACNVSIKVFAVEMVYIPQGNFYAGDGAVTGIIGQFEAGTTSAPFQVTSEALLTLGGGGAGSMGNNNAQSMSTQDDFNDVTSTTLPAAFPKGFQAFYTMKYEISQEQYAEFLNTLTVPQQLARHGGTVVNRYITNTSTPSNRNGVKVTTLPVGANAGTYSCDLNNNGVFNETTDGQNIACNWLSGPDLLAYYDWSALRPMTEMELEKMARGTLPAVPHEYAWGSTAIYSTSYAALSNPGAGNELPNSPSTTVGNVVDNSTSNVGGIQGPLRVGIFATATSSRVTAGASYFGVMELSGNLWEVPVGVGNAAGRSYTGLHGNGSLNTAGYADVDFWPGVNGNNSWAAANTAYLGTTGSTQAAGLGFRMGTWNNNSWLEISDRSYPAWTGTVGREVRQGGRGIRTAP